jgi:nicotinate-nucleotide pyrophosphorylase (carboxylating)
MVFVTLIYIKVISGNLFIYFEELEFIQGFNIHSNDYSQKSVKVCIMRSDLARMIYDDIGFEDITTCALIPPGLNVKGQIISKEEGIVAGVELAFEIFREFGVETEILKNDGEKIRPSQIIMEIEGDPRKILTLERTVLNLMMRMSGIATLTSEMVEMVRKVNPDVLVAGTRKTTPGLQFFEKKAIRS